MASNNRTSKSVLDAPRSIPVLVSDQPGQNRAGRRHVMLDSHGHQIPMAASITIPKAARQPATNVPHVAVLDTHPRRSKKAARHALRFA